MAALLNSLFFVFKISFLPKYRVKYYYDVTYGDFVYIDSAIFKYQTDLFYCAQDIGAVVCPFIYHYATHTGDGFRTVRHLGIIVRTDRTCVSGSGGNYPDPACLDARVKYRNCSVMLDCSSSLFMMDPVGPMIQQQYY